MTTLLTVFAQAPAECADAMTWPGAAVGIAGFAAVLVWRIF